MAKKYENGEYYDDEISQSNENKGTGSRIFGPDGTILGRTPENWVRLATFYLVFYSVLAAVFAVSFWVFYQTIDPRIPKWRLSKSLIGTSPGLGFRPMPPYEDIESTLIWYRGTRRENYKHWVTSLEEFLEVYKKPGLTPGRGQNIFDCDYNRYPRRGQVCNVDFRNWHPCVAENEFNYHKSGPCIFLKLNKIYGWIPEYYNSSRSLPRAMPRDLKQHIQTIEATAPEQMNTIWVSCEGENPADIENIGHINYIPRRGFPGFFFPYENSEGYLSPIMAIHIERPERGILINIQCKAWARNIEHKQHERIGLVHFELMVF